MNKSKKNNNKLLHNRKKYSKIGGLHRILRNLDVGYDLSLDNFHKFLESSAYDDLTMIIGIDYMYLEDTNRMLEQNNQVDFGWTYNKDDRHNPSGKDNWYQINDSFDILIQRFINEKNILKVQFNNIARFLNKNVNFRFIETQNKYNKFKKIIFDSSTTKFLDNTIFINIVYNFLLNVNGELYFEPDFLAGKLVFMKETDKIDGITIDHVNNIRTEINSLPLTEYGNNYYIQKYSNSPNIELIPVDYNNVINNNIEYLQKHLLYSQVQYIHNISNKMPNDMWQNSTYPIQFTNYPIGSFFKITKTNNLDMNDLTDISIILDSYNKQKFLNF